LVGHISDKNRRDKAGDHAELGIRLALAELSKDNALSDALGRPVQVRHTDTRGNTDAFESQAVRLDSVNRAIALIGGQSGPEVAALDQVKIPILTLHGHAMAGAGKHVFYLGMSPVRQGTSLAKVVAENAKTQRIAVLVDERRPDSIASVERFLIALTEARSEAKADAVAAITLRFGGHAHLKDLLDQAKGKADSVVLRVQSSKERWEEIISRLRGHNAQAIYFAGSVADFNEWHRMWRKEMAEATPEIVYAGDDVAPAAFDQGEPATSIVYATAFVNDPANARTAAFVKAYRDAFQVEADVHAALAYDGFRIAMEATKKSQPAQLTTERLRDELAKIKGFDGLTGPLSFNADRQLERTLFVVRWHNGTATTLKKFDPPEVK
jgi:ABC-type branched-subunit amino acid transport system substrate-binding protein